MEIYVVGIGAGSADKMTYEAMTALEGAEAIVGYTLYVKQVQKLFPDKEYIVSGMKQEKERCLAALKLVKNGKKTAVVCSGDAGVYGMASLMHELAPRDIEIRVVAGVTAAVSGAALLGAPLSHDFAVISLSDLLTPWEKIEKRLECAAMADFVICIYNPSSKKRADYLEKACDIMLKYKSPDTVCGIAVNIGREGEKYKIMSLSELRDTKTDMFTTVFVGNECTKEINGRMVTPRGYRL